MVSTATLTYAHNQAQKPSLLLWVSAGMVFALAIAFMLGAALAAVASYTENDFGYLVITLAATLAAALLAALEYAAIRLQSRLAALLIAVPLVIGGGLGLISLGRGILGLIGAMSVDREFGNWFEVWGMMGVVTVMSFIGIMDLRWAMVLKRWQARERALGRA